MGPAIDVSNRTAAASERLPVGACWRGTKKAAREGSPVLAQPIQGSPGGGTVNRIVRWCLLGIAATTLLFQAGPAVGAPGASTTLVFARQEETETLDPHKTTAISSAEVDYTLYDTLTSLDYDNTVKPGLAEKWEISPDGKTYAFALRPGVKFHSGKALTSADVKFTLDRWRTVKGSPTAS